MRFDLRCCERVVRNDPRAVFRDDEDSGALGGVGSSRVALQPLVELRLSAIEVVELVASSQPLGPPVRHPLVEDASIGEELGQTGNIPRLSVERRRETLPVLVVEQEACPVAQNTVRLHHRRVNDEVCQGAMRDFGSAPDQVIRRALDAKVPPVCRTCHLCHAIQCTDDVRTRQTPFNGSQMPRIADTDSIPFKKAAVCRENGGGGNRTRVRGRTGMSIYKHRPPLRFARRPVGGRPTDELALLKCRASGEWLSFGAEPAG